MHPHGACHVAEQARSSHISDLNVGNAFLGKKALQGTEKEALQAGRQQMPETQMQWPS